MARLSAIVLVGLFVASRAWAQTDEELKHMTLQELLDIEVTTVSRVPEPVATVPAAVFVITTEDIRRSGATSIPEALRLAPGIQIARIDAARWAIGMRGFADRLARSVLVLVDGRAVYSPLFAGTYWETQDTLLEDVDRIEVIRGPGGTLWGANAVNGIVNIVTKSARDTQGPLLTAGGGPDGQAQAGFRWGVATGQTGHLRGYVKGLTHAPQNDLTRPNLDTWRTGQAGFRGDWAMPDAFLTVQGDAYAARLGQRVTIAAYDPPYADTIARTAPLAGGNLLARYTGAVGSTHRYQIQTYFDRTRRDELPVAETRRTWDLDFQQVLTASSRHAIVWGLGYRVSADGLTTVGPTSFAPAARTDNLFSAFLQDDVALLAGRVHVAFGSKVEHNDDTGVEIQPSVRVSWTPSDTETWIWSITRAVRTPSRVETDYATTSLSSARVPSFVRLTANPDFVSEELVAHELGYRRRAGSRAYLTLAGFLNEFDHVLSTEFSTPFVETTPGTAHQILPVSFGNGLRGRSYGGEATADLRPMRWLRTTANYSYEQIEMTRRPGSTDVSQERRNEGLTPRHQLQLTSSLDLPKGVSVDWQFRYASRLEVGSVPAYSTSDLRVAWLLRPGIELALVGENLHQATHLEWSGATVPIRRTGYLKLTWRP